MGLAAHRCRRGLPSRLPAARTGPCGGGDPFLEATPASTTRTRDPCGSARCKPRGAACRSRRPCLSPGAIPAHAACLLRSILGTRCLFGTVLMPNGTYPGHTPMAPVRSEEHTSELQSRRDLVCRLLLEKKKKIDSYPHLTTTKKAIKKT